MKDLEPRNAIGFGRSPRAEGMMGADVVTQPLEVLTMGLGGEIFALEAGIVLEILDLVPVTEVPNSQPFVNGLINVRGKVVPLADLRLKLGMERREAGIDSRIVVIEVNLEGEPTLVGILADKVYEVTEVAAASIEAPPRIGMKWRSEFIRCIGKRGDDFIIVLDINRVFASQQQAYLGTVEEPV